MVRRTNPRYCIGERRPTGPEKISYGLPTFKTRAEAEKEKAWLDALPEKAGLDLFVTILPEKKPKAKPPRKQYRRSRR